MSLSNILNRDNAAPPDVLLYCQGLRCSETCQCKNLLVSNESTMLGPLSVFGLQHDYGDLTVDGTLTAGIFAVGNITANNITCQSISGVTGSFSGPVTAASLSAPAVTGTNSNFSGVAVSGSIITSNITMSGGYTAGATGTVLNLKVNNSANITNDLTVGDVINCNVLNSNVINTQNVNCDGAVNTETFSASQLVILPDLDTAQRDSLPQQEASILYNNETLTPQIYGNSLWNNISYYPQIASYFLNSDESVADSFLFKIGSLSNMKEIFNSNAGVNFDYVDFGVWKINTPGIYKVNCTVAIQPSQADYHELILYLYFGKSDGSYMYDGVGLVDDVGPYHFPNKEQKYQFECTALLEQGEHSFFMYQKNDTSGNFNIVTSPNSPIYISYNNIFTLQFLSPKF